MRAGEQFKMSNEDINYLMSLFYILYKLFLSVIIVLLVCYLIGLHKT